MARSRRYYNNCRNLSAPSLWDSHEFLKRKMREYSIKSTKIG
jgi:hypothetical protein